MYSVGWTHRAVADLRSKVKTKAVRKYLVEVSRTSLHRHFPRWGGSTEDLKLWRRGVTEQDEAFLDQLEDRDISLNDGQDEGRNYVLVYHREETVDGDRYEITGVLTNGEMAAAW